MSIVLLSRDLMLSSKLEGAARRVDQTLKVIGTDEAVLESVADCRVMVVDLEIPGLDIDELVQNLKARSPEGIQVIAYAPHVRTEKLAAAKEAGCDLVVSRGQIMSDAESILRSFL
ncbi:hypothetical protein [Bythopirellula goksoeyrii]|uniref:Response regulatory domain-containing protein n=1 Tax=Bythopirellula goksoeyrii TaxID=1400387 RepID=A0A5B9Q8Q1_9BACT|nr:hypothetical protein [Bythopirellula goksoeyrii]QEG34059.1 hypothetical protein Pr1d_13310 [Bythopirellula goksoeyrii]